MTGNLSGHCPYSAEAGEVKYTDVLAALKHAVEKSQPGDTLLLFFFAGHGSRRNAKDYLLLSDSDPDHFDQTALSLDTLRTLLTDCKATQRLFVIDACRNSSRADGKSGFADGKLDKSFQERLDRVVRQTSSSSIQTALLYACSPGQTSRESDEERAGVFTQRLIQALSGADSSSPITLAEVYRSICAAMPASLADRQNSFAARLRRSDPASSCGSSWSSLQSRVSCCSSR